MLNDDEVDVRSQNQFCVVHSEKKGIKQNKRKTTLMIYLIGAVYVIAITLLIQDGLRKSRRARTPIITGR